MKKFIFSLIFFTISIQSFALADEETQIPKSNRIDNYQTITISQSGSLFYSVTNEITQSVKNLNSNLSFIGRANVGLEKVTDESGNDKLTSNKELLLVFFLLIKITYIIFQLKQSRKILLTIYIQKRYRIKLTRI